MTCSMSPLLFKSIIFIIRQSAAINVSVRSSFRLPNISDRNSSYAKLPPTTPLMPLLSIAYNLICPTLSSLGSPTADVLLENITSIKLIIVVINFKPTL